jgi:hypothetical protein
MALKDCEIRELYIRGLSSDVIFGREPLSAAELKDLRAEFLALRPAASRVTYLSRDGFQPLLPVPKERPRKAEASSTASTASTAEEAKP